MCNRVINKETTVQFTFDSCDAVRTLSILRSNEKIMQNTFLIFSMTPFSIEKGLVDMLWHAFIQPLEIVHLNVAPFLHQSIP